MRKLLFALFLLTLPANVWAACTGSNPNWTTTVDQASFQTCVNNAASGSTIHVSAGTVTGQSTVTISGKALTIIGAGQGTTNFGASGVAFDINASATNFVDISGMSVSGANSNGAFQVDGTPYSVAVRIHSLTLTTTTGRGFLLERVFGLIDHSTVNQTGSGCQTFTFQGAPDSQNAQTDPWSNLAPAFAFGTVNAFFVEDSTINFSCGNDSVTDSYGGARWVQRHNIYNMNSSGEGFGGGHGTDSGDRWGGPISCEVYNNVFNNTTGSGTQRAGTLRGGTCVFHDNTYVTGSIGGVTLMLYRACADLTKDLHWNQCNGTAYRVTSALPSNVWKNTTAAINGGANCTANGANGVGSNCAFCSGNKELRCSSDATCSSAGAGSCSYNFDGPGTLGYPCRNQVGLAPGQISQPIYVWNNGGHNAGTFDGNSACATTAGAPDNLTPWIQSGREFVNNGSTPMPGYTAFVYPHPLQGGPPQVGAPTFSPVAGTYSSTQSVSLSTTTPGATICYTTNGSTPTTNGGGSCTSGSVYSTPISVPSSLTITAIGTMSGATDSAVTSAAYTIAPSITTFYLDNSGSPACSDTAGQSGDAGHPFCTLNYAVSRLSSGNTLYVKNGTYDNGSTITGPSGTPTASTVISAFPTHTPIFTSGSTSSGRIRLQGLSYFILTGLTIQTINQCIFVDSSDHVIVQHNVCSNIGQEAIHVHFNSSFSTIDSNTVTSAGALLTNGECGYTGSGSSDPATDNTHDITWSNNNFAGCAGEGIEVKPGTHNITVGPNNNVSTWNNANIGSGGAGIELDESTGGGQSWPSNPQHLVFGNIVHDNGTGTSGISGCSGIRVGTGATVINNIVYNISACGNGIYSNSADGNTYPKLIYNNTVDVPSARAVVNSGGSPTITNDIGPPTSGSNVVVSSSYFVDYTGHNYRLLGGSLPVGHGSNVLSTVATDIAGVSRGLPMDIGAYAYIASNLAIPVFTPGAGTYPSAQNVALSTPSNGAAICYTVNGTLPTTNGAGLCTAGSTYGSPIAVTVNLTINAIVTRLGDIDSSVGTAAYIVSAPPPNPTSFVGGVKFSNGVIIR